MRHEMATRGLDITGIRDLTGDRFHPLRRTDGVVGTADHESRTGDTPELPGEVHLGQHAVDGGKPLRIVRQPALPILLKALAVAPEALRVGPREALLDGCAHAPALDRLGTLQRLGAPLRPNARGR